MQKQRRAICIFGPTASGKTGLAIALAKAHNGVIVNADSRQIYTGIDIISAMPSTVEFAAAEHQMFRFLPPQQRYSVGRYIKAAKAAAEEIFAQNKIPIFVGGTGLYLKNLIDGINVIPDVSSDTEAAIEAEIAAKGLAAAHRCLGVVDPVTAARLEPTDKQRITRALSVFAQTDKPLSEWQETPREGELDADVLRVGILPPRAELHARIEQRLAQMVAAGVEAEIRALYDAGLSADLPALTGLGVAEFYRYFAGEISLTAAQEAVLISHRQYAKRQCTWLKNTYNGDIVVEKAADALPLVDNWVNNKAS